MNPERTRTVMSTPVYQALKERIMDRRVAPSARLNIDALALELKVSQTPLREALTRLTTERLVNFEPFKGYSVTPLLSSRRFSELMEVRRALEGTAIRQAVVRINSKELHHLQSLIDTMQQSVPGPEFRTYQAFNRLDQQFHELIFQIADNLTLLETYQSLNTHVQLARLDLTGHEIAADESYREHTKILETLKNRDAVAADNAMQQHLNSVEVRLGLQLDYLILQHNIGAAPERDLGP
jgi:DNA-binding GntR family transcriptional regulator